MSRILVFFWSIDRYVKAVFHKGITVLVRNQHCSACRYAYDSCGDCAEGAVIKFDSHCFFRCCCCCLLYAPHYNSISANLSRPHEANPENFLESFGGLFVYGTAPLRWVVCAGWFRRN